MRAGAGVMLLPEFQRMLDVVLPCAQPMSLTLTELPLQSGHLAELLEKAVNSGNRNRTRLTGIQVPLRLFPGLAGSFDEVPVMDSGTADVVRLFFTP
jgi:hypothetical protein